MKTEHKTQTAIQSQCDGKCRFAWVIPKVQGAVGMRENYYITEKGRIYVKLFVPITHRQIKKHLIY